MRTSSQALRKKCSETDSSRYKDLLKDYLDIRNEAVKITEQEFDWVWHPFKINAKGVQSYYLTDKKGNWFISAKQIDIANNETKGNTRKLFNDWKAKKYENINRPVFIEGYDKDYFYRPREEIPKVPKNPMSVQPTLTKKPSKRHTGGKPILLFSTSGAAKINFRKRNDSALRFADGIVERDRDFIEEQKQRISQLEQEYQREIKALESIPITYKEWSKNIKIDKTKKYVDMDGNPLESKLEVNVGNACWILKNFTGVDLGPYHPNIIKFTPKEREKYLNFFDPNILKRARWDKEFPWSFQPDWGFKLIPETVCECWGLNTKKYNACRRIKEYIYKERGYKLISIEEGEDANFPFLIDTLIKKLQLRKRKEFRGKL